MIDKHEVLTSTLKKKSSKTDLSLLALISNCRFRRKHEIPVYVIDKGID